MFGIVEYIKQAICNETVHLHLFRQVVTDQVHLDCKERGVPLMTDLASRVLEMYISQNINMKLQDIQLHVFTLVAIRGGIYMFMIQNFLGIYANLRKSES